MTSRLLGELGDLLEGTSRTEATLWMMVALQCNGLGFEDLAKAVIDRFGTGGQVGSLAETAIQLARNDGVDPRPFEVPSYPVSGWGARFFPADRQVRDDLGTEVQLSDAEYAVLLFVFFEGRHEPVPTPIAEARLGCWLDSEPAGLEGVLRSLEAKLAGCCFRVGRGDEQLWWRGGS